MMRCVQKRWMRCVVIAVTSVLCSSPVHGVWSWINGGLKAFFEWTIVDRATSKTQPNHGNMNSSTQILMTLYNNQGGISNGMSDSTAHHADFIASSQWWQEHGFRVSLAVLGGAGLVYAYLWSRHAELFEAIQEGAWSYWRSEEVVLDELRLIDHEVLAGDVLKEFNGLYRGQSARPLSCFFRDCTSEKEALRAYIAFVERIPVFILGAIPDYSAEYIDICRERLQRLDILVAAVRGHAKTF